MFRGMLIAAAAVGLAMTPQVRGEEAISNIGETFVGRGGVELRLLLDESNFGASDIEIAEILFPAGTDSGDHAHAATEIFYVLSGELEHVVNGESALLRPGMVGYVRPPDLVRHRTTVDTRALVIWVPGGEGTRIVQRLRRRASE